MDTIINRISSLINRGHARSVQAKKHVLASFAIKGGNILISFLLVPLTITYLDQTRYGIWLTLSSVVMWINFFDIGLGNGMRNKFAQAKARGDMDKARIYVSTTYAAMFLIMGSVFLVFLGIYPLVNWSRVLNTPDNLGVEIGSVVLLVFGFFCLRFVLKLLGKLLIADQRPSLNLAFNLGAGIISILVIYFLTKTTEGSLLYVSATLSAAPVLVLLLASVIFFRGRYRQFRPSLKYVRMSEFRSLMGLGSQFFLIQLASVMLFTTDNMIITQILGPEEVTTYNIAHKYFHIIPIAFGIITTPLWSAFTEAYTKGEYDWIKNVINKSLKLWGVVVGVVILMVLGSNLFYQFWVGDKVQVPMGLSMAMALFVSLSTLNSIFVTFINGVGKLRLQIFTAIFSILVNIPLSYLFAVPLGLGLSGVILATTCSILLSLVLRPWQYYLIINQKATGIWNK
jgi:O-antigen/teichoic acid export membrane protein